MSEDVFTNEDLWAWAESEDAEQWHGPFKTREEAEAALLSSEEGAEGWVSEARRFDAGLVAAEAMHAETVLEHMNEHDEAMSFDDQVFDFPVDKPVKHRAAVRALADALATWAREHVVVCHWCVVGDPVFVKALATVPAPPPAPEAGQ